MGALALALLGLALSGLAVTGSAGAQDAVLHVVTYVEVIPPSAAEGAALLRQYRDAARRDEGNLRLEVLQRVDRPNQFAVVAAWKSAKAFEVHAAAPPARELRARLAPLLASPDDERLHTGLAVGSTPPAAGAGAVHVVTHVDVIPPRKDESLPLLRQFAVDARSEPGNLGADVLQQTNRPNHFTVLEVWRDRPAFDAHVAAAPTRRFREQLTPMSGALYDERLYVRLD